jgi:hypothetical protein
MSLTTDASDEALIDEFDSETISYAPSTRSASSNFYPTPSVAQYQDESKQYSFECRNTGLEPKYVIKYPSLNVITPSRALKHDDATEFVPARPPFISMNSASSSSSSSSSSFPQTVEDPREVASEIEEWVAAMNAISLNNLLNQDTRSGHGRDQLQDGNGSHNFLSYQQNVLDHVGMALRGETRHQIEQRESRQVARIERERERQARAQERQIQTRRVHDRRKESS